MFREEIRVIRPQIKAKRILVTSDVHGNLDLFDELLEKMSYVPGEDALVVVGDLIQKGPRNLDTLHRMMELSKVENVFLLYGNNDLFIEADDGKVFDVLSWFKYNLIQGEMMRELHIPLPETLEDFCAARQVIEQAYRTEFEFLRSLPDVLETDKFLFVHGGAQSEDFTQQKLWDVLTVPRFHETAEHVFSKLLVVGHWPTANYRTEILSNAPVYNAEKNVLSIDGGNMVKTLGQLNGVILDNETGQWTWTCADAFPKITAPCSQKARTGTVITWPDNYVDLLERHDDYLRCRVQRTGEVMDIPLHLIYEDCGNGVYRSEDVTSSCPDIEKGDELSLVWQGEDKLLVMKNGQAGFLYLSGKPDGKED